MQLRVVLDASHLQTLEQSHAVTQVNRTGTAAGILEIIGIVTEDIEDAFDKGRVTVDGLSWKARSANGETLPAGTRVTVREMQGVTLTVEKAP